MCVCVEDYYLKINLKNITKIRVLYLYILYVKECNNISHVYITREQFSINEFPDHSIY